MKKITSLGIIFLFSIISFNLKAEINFDLTTVGGTKVMDYDAVSTERNKPQAERWITVVNFGNSGTASKCGTATKTFDIKSGRTIAFYLAKCDKMIISANMVVGRGLTYTINDGTSTTLAGTTVCKDYEVIVNSETPVKIIVQGLNSSSAWTSFFTFTYAAKVPAISAFSINGFAANIDQELKKISLEMPYGTDITNVAPLVTLGGTATSYSPAGAQNFASGTIVYTASDAVPLTTDYNVDITVKATPDTEKAITSMTINGKIATIDESTGSITCDFPSFQGPLSNWPVVFTLNSLTAVADFTSGNSFDFGASPTQTITVTAQDLTTKVYTVSPTVSTKKNIGMLTLNGKAETYDNLLVSAFSDYYITYLLAAATAPADINAFYANYDLLVLHANVSGTNSTGLATEAMVGVKPILNLKAFFYNSGRWSWSTTAPGNAVAGTSGSEVITSLQVHPIFNNVNFSETTLSFYDGLPPANTNAIQYASDLATLPSGMKSYTIAKSGTGIQMHEIQDNAAAKYLMVGLSMENNNFTYFNSNTINILKNSSEYLLNPTLIFDYQPIISGIKNNESGKVYFNNGILYNPEMKPLTVFNSTGIKVLVTNKTSMDTKLLPTGIYMVINGDMKVYKFIK